MKRHKKKKKRAKINNINAVKDDNTDTANGSKNSIKKILSTVLVTVLFSKLTFIFLPFVSSSGGISATCRIGSYSAAGAWLVVHDFVGFHLFPFKISLPSNRLLGLLRYGKHMFVHVFL